MAGKGFSVNICKIRDASSTVATCILGESLLVKTNRHEEISASNSAPLSDMFSTVSVKKNVSKKSFSKNSLRHCSYNS